MALLVAVFALSVALPHTLGGGTPGTPTVPGTPDAPGATTALRGGSTARRDWEFGEVPGWCCTISGRSKQESCQGSARRCSCEDWCSSAPRVSTRWNPKCCGCEGLSTSATLGTRPVWCDLVPESFQDAACTGCMCKRACRNVPTEFWGWIPRCCACPRNVAGDSSPKWEKMSSNETSGEDDGDYDDHFRDDDSDDDDSNDENDVTDDYSYDDDDMDNDDKLFSSGTASGTRPAWCKYMSESFQGVVCCSSAQGCSCQQWCSHTPAASWRWNPECCDCGDASPKQSSLTTSRTRPAWCEFVPEPLRDTACRGSGQGCTCREWCSYTPRASWTWNPECCACENSSGCSRCRDWCSYMPSGVWRWVPECCACGDALTNQTTDVTVNRSTRPAWCEYIPVRYQDHACGPQGCACREWCSRTPLASRPWNPECCKCEI